MSKHPALPPALGAAVLLATGLMLLAPDTPARPTAHAPSAAATTPPIPPPASPTPTPAPSRLPIPPPTPQGTPSPSTTPPPEAMPSGIAAAGDGPEGDPAIEAAFTKDHPSDLPPADSARMGALAGQVWLAETTGRHRDRWPAYFPAVQGAAPIPLYTDVRIQATAAHTEDASPNRVRVDLLWAGTSPIGEYGDHRPATVHLIRTTTGWEPAR